MILIYSFVREVRFLSIGGIWFLSLLLFKLLYDIKGVNIILFVNKLVLKVSILVFKVIIIFCVEFKCVVYLKFGSCI